MRTNTFAKVSVAVAITAIAATLVQGQQDEVKDEDLMKLMDKMAPESAEPSATAKQQDAVVDQVEIVAVQQDGEVDQLDAAAESVDDMTMATVPQGGMAESENNLISVRLNKVGLEEAINVFAQLSGANIVVPELADAAQISVNLKDVEWRPALQSILDTYDYELYQRVSGSNVYSVRRRPAGAPEPQVVETFVLKYATVPNVAQLVRDLLPEDAQVSEFASRNMLVVKSTESSLGEVRSVLESIDKVRQQVYIESKFMELSDDAQRDLGIDWQSLSAYGLTASANGGTFYGKEFVTGTPSENLTGLTTPLTTDGEYAILSSVLDADDFSLVLSAMKNNKGVNIVSNPKIIVANEELANISIIRKEPNLKRSSQQALNNNNPQLSYELDPDLPFFEYGIKLDVIPSINTSSNISVKIKPTLARKFAEKKSSSSADGLDLLSYPIIDEKSIDTVFNLASGQTAAIGGLTEVTESEEEHKIPLLGSIPLLGRFFAWEQTINNQKETIIFVTVGLANTQQLETETGMPTDAELSRRRVIDDTNNKKLREQTREYYETQEGEKLDDMLKKMSETEAKRVERRERKLADK